MDWRPWYGELGTVAVPILQASGSLTFDEVRLRFIVIDRLGADLDKFFKSILSMAPMEPKKDILKFAARCRD